MESCTCSTATVAVLVAGEIDQCVSSDIKPFGPCVASCLSKPGAFHAAVLSVVVILLLSSRWRRLMNSPHPRGFTPLPDPLEPGQHRRVHAPLLIHWWMGCCPGWRGWGRVRSRSRRPSNGTAAARSSSSLLQMQMQKETETKGWPGAGAGWLTLSQPFLLSLRRRSPAFRRKLLTPLLFRL